MQGRPACYHCHYCGTKTEKYGFREYCPTCKEDIYPANHGHPVHMEDFSPCFQISMKTEIDLKKYQDGYGMFKAVASPSDPHWFTERGQKFLEEFYILDEQYKLGVINSDEMLFYKDSLNEPELLQF